MYANDNPKSSVRLVTIKKFLTLPKYGWLSESSLRHLIFKAQSRTNSKGEVTPGNGMIESGSIIRLGKKILIDLERFDAWVEQHRQGGGIAEEDLTMDVR